MNEKENEMIGVEKLTNATMELKEVLSNLGLTDEQKNSIIQFFITYNKFIASVTTPGIIALELLTKRTKADNE